MGTGGSARPIGWLVSLLLASACASAGEPQPGVGEARGRFASLGLAELPVKSVEAPGFVDFFVGEAVLREYAQSDGFVPAADKRYSMIRVPEAMLELAESDTSSPVT